MKRLLNAGFGFPLPRLDIDWILSLGFAGIRTDASNPDPLIRYAQIKQLSRWKYSLPLFKHGDSTDLIDELVTSVSRNGAKIGIELGNEHNIDVGADEHLRWLYNVRGSIPSHIPVYAGSIHALIPKAMKWAEKVIPMMPEEYIPALHPYRTELDQHEGLELLDEWYALRPGRFGITEVGWHTAPQRKAKKFPLCFLNDHWSWTDEDVARIAAAERTFWENEGADLLVWYQLNDGPNENYDQDRFGIRDIDGNPKPVSEVWK